MRLLIKYASRGRPELFQQTINNIVETIDTQDYKVLVSCDIDDVSMKPFGSINEHNPNISISYRNNKSKIQAINNDMHDVRFDWLVNMSDDMRFTVKGWDQLMLDDIRRKWPTGTDWFAHFNDGFVGHKLPTMSIMGWDYYQRDKYIYHPSYNSVSADAEAMFVAMMRGRHHYFPEVYFNHLHPANTRQKTDATYLGNHIFDKPDTHNYFERMKICFDVKNPIMIPDEIRRAILEA